MIGKPEVQDRTQKIIELRLLWHKYGEPMDLVDFVDIPEVKDLLSRIQSDPEEVTHHGG